MSCTRFIWLSSVIAIATLVGIALGAKQSKKCRLVPYYYTIEYDEGEFKGCKYERVPTFVCVGLCDSYTEPKEYYHK